VALSVHNAQLSAQETFGGTHGKVEFGFKCVSSETGKWTDRVAAMSSTVCKQQNALPIYRLLYNHWLWHWHT
jgi:hypothetical protein